MINFVLLALVGLGAQLVDGSLGMAYGVVVQIGVPGAVGAFAGATVLSRLATGLAAPVMAAVLLALGV